MSLLSELSSAAVHAIALHPRFLALVPDNGDRPDSKKCAELAVALAIGMMREMGIKDEEWKK